MACVLAVVVLVGMIGVAGACPYYCTCSSSINKCSDFVGSPPSPEFMRAEKSGRWDFSVGNNISTINAESFEGLSSVVELNFSHNTIGEIPEGTFQELTNLKVLDLSHNNLKRISKDTFLGLRNLQVLNLSYNLMWAYSEEDLFSHLSSLRELSVAHPLLACDCVTVGWLTRWAADNGVAISNDSVCYDPLAKPSDPPVRLNQLHFKGRQCPDSSPTLPVYEIRPSTRQIVFERDALQLNCSVTLPPGTSLKWLQGDQPVSSGQESGRRQVFSSVHGSVTHSMVRVDNLRDTDSGYWECAIISEESGERLIPGKKAYIMVVAATASLCPKETTPSIKGSFTWPKTISGYEQSLECPFGRSSLYARKALAFRMCDHGTWLEPDLTTCEFESTHSRQITRLLMDMEWCSATRSCSLAQASEVARSLANITRDAAALMTNWEDVKYTSDTVLRLFQFMDVQQNYNDQMIEDMIEIASNCLAFKQELLGRAQELHGSSAQLADTLQKTVIFSVNRRTVFRHAAHNIVVRTFRITQIGSFHGYTCALLLSHAGQSFTEGMLECQTGVADISSLRMGHTSVNQVFAAVKLPPDLIGGGSASSGGSNFFKLQIVIYRNGSLFQDQSHSVISPVVSTRLEPVEAVAESPAAGGQSDGGGRRVEIDLALLARLNDRKASTWDGGSWVEGGAGCTVIGSSLENQTRVSCQSLATVAVTSVSDLPHHSFDHLEAVIQIGCATCIAFTALIVATYLFFRKHIFSTSKSMHVLVNFCISLLCLCCLFSWGNLFTPRASRTLSAGGRYVACSLVFVALHYFLLVAALWLVLYNRHMCKQFYKIDRYLHQPTRARVPRPLLRFYALAWGLPAVVCLLTTLASFTSRPDDPSQKCWLRPELGVMTTFIPAGVCAVVCAIYMLRTLLILPRLPRKLEVRQHCTAGAASAEHHLAAAAAASHLHADFELSNITDNESVHSGRHHAAAAGPNNNNVVTTFTVKADSNCCRQLRAAVIVFLLFIASWVFGALTVFYQYNPPPADSHTNRTRVCSYIFAISIAALGSYLFIKFCLLRSDVKQCYIAFITCQKQVTYPKPSRVTHSLYLNHHNSYLSLESGANNSHQPSQTNRSHPLNNQTTSYTFSDSVVSSSQECRGVGGAPGFYNPVDTIISRGHGEKSRAIYPAKTSSRSGSSLRGGQDDDMFSMGEKQNAAAAAAMMYRQMPHHRSQTSLPESWGAPAGSTGGAGHKPPGSTGGGSQVGGSDHEKHQGAKSGLSGGRNTPVSLPQQPPAGRLLVGQPAVPLNMSSQAINSYHGTPVSYNPANAPNAAPPNVPRNVQPIMTNGKSFPGMLPGSSQNSILQSTILANQMNRSQQGGAAPPPPPDLLQSYFAARSAAAAGERHTYSSDSPDDSSADDEDDSSPVHKPGKAAPPGSASPAYSDQNETSV